MTEGTPIDREKLLSLSVMKGGRPKHSKVVEGQAHPDSGLRFKATTDELGHTVTEHSAPGATGVSVRQDVHIQAQTVRGLTTTT